MIQVVQPATVIYFQIFRNFAVSNADFHVLLYSTFFCFHTEEFKELSDLECWSYFPLTIGLIFLKYASAQESEVLSIIWNRHGHECSRIWKLSGNFIKKCRDFLGRDRGNSPKCGRCSIADGIGSLYFLLTFLNKKIN